MNICYFSCSTKFGGVEKILVDTTNQLINYHNILVIVPARCEYLAKFSSEVNVKEYDSFDKRYNLFLHYEIYKLLRKFNITLVHTHASKASQIVYFINKFRKDFIHVATKHNIRKGKIFNKIKNVVAVSKEVSNTISHKSKVIYFGIEPKIIKSNLTEQFSLIAVGRLDKIKGFDKLIEEVSKLTFDFRLDIIGDGEEKENLLSLIKKLNLENKVNLLGFKDDIPKYLSNTHLQIISSKSEGLPITLIEGIHYSNIILSTPVGGIIEILKSNFLCSEDELSLKIEEIYQNYDKKLEKFKEDHEKLKIKLTMKNYINELLDYYAKL